MKKNRKIVLAYSGGLDTSIILKWLQKKYNAEVIAYTADIGQKIDRVKIFKSAKKLGIKKLIIENLKDLFVKDGYSNAFDNELRKFLKEIKSEDVPSNFTTFYSNYIKEENKELSNIKFNKDIF